VVDLRNRRSVLDQPRSLLTLAIRFVYIYAAISLFLASAAASMSWHS